MTTSHVTCDKNLFIFGVDSIQYGRMAAIMDFCYNVLQIDLYAEWGRCIVNVDENK